MMNEWGIPTVYLECLAYDMCERLAAKNAYIPPIAIAGGLSLEDHIFKAIALGAPYVKAVCLGHALMAAAMVGKTQGNKLKESVGTAGVESEVSRGIEAELLSTFALGAELKEKFGNDFLSIPPGAIGVYSYISRLRQGMQQLMAGTRKFALRYVERDDLVALTREAAGISGIPYIMDHDKEKIAQILDA